MNRHPDLNNLLNSFLSNRENLIKSHKCVMCKEDTIEFRDLLSKMEYDISNMCQKCQDATFGVDDE